LKLLFLKITNKTFFQKTHQISSSKVKNNSYLIIKDNFIYIIHIKQQALKNNLIFGLYN